MGCGRRKFEEVFTGGFHGETLNLKFGIFP
jgi:hypothetical protein